MRSSSQCDRARGRGVFSPPSSQRLCAKASGAILSQAPEHDADHGDVDPGFFTARKHFVVKGSPAPGGKPGERALHDPAPLEHVKAAGPDLLPIDDGVLWSPDAHELRNEIIAGSEQA